MQQIASGVYQIPGYSNAYIVDGDSGVVLVDTGMPKRHGAILEALKAIGRELEQVTAIAITHAHVDHAGNAATLRGQTNAPVIASNIDAPALRGEEKYPLPPFLDRVPFLKPLFRLLPSAEATEVDHLVGEGKSSALPADMQVVASPGHTPGHVSFLLDRNGGILLVGDAAVATKDGRVKRGFMNRSTPTFDASIQHIAEYDFEVALFAHSTHLEQGASIAFREFASSMR
jgi:glyoxylase-like metal-dependent hydrolase (beta-lactamase superfamily II)